MDRREFLLSTGKLGLGLLGLSVLDGCATTPQRQAYRISGWTGDSFPPMHRIRDQYLPPTPPPSQKVDIAIVGGGLSGLACAYYLRNENFILLEREATLGGNAKQREFQGVPYALGSAYLVDIEEPFGTLYSELGLTLNPIPHPADVSFESGGWKALESGSLAKPFEKMKQYLKEMLASKDFPLVPIEKASPVALALDKISFYDYLKNDYPVELLQIIDAYCFSALGGSIRQISAYAGINFYSEIAGEIYAFPGGNAAVSKKLTEKIDLAGSGRCMTQASVYHIQPQEEKVSISYFHSQSGEAKTLEAKAVIMATPYFFNARILKNLSKPHQDFLKSLEYGAYLVANCCFNQRVFQSGYDHWMPENNTFTDFITADYATMGNNKKLYEKNPFVLTVYAPFRNAMAGRHALLQGNKEAFANAIAKQLHRAIQFPWEALEEIHLTRYGHQLLTSRVGLIKDLRNYPKSFEKVFFCHSDGQGMASIESALTEAFRVLKEFKKR